MAAGLIIDIAIEEDVSKRLPTNRSGITRLTRHHHDGGAYPRT
jgi:hypothetical protein